MFTVIDVIRSMKIEPTRELTLAVGNSASKTYLDKFGVLPDKELRRKTKGSGTHCIAVYPTEFRATVRKIVKTKAAV